MIANQQKGYNQSSQLSKFQILQFSQEYKRVDTQYCRQKTLTFFFKRHRGTYGDRQQSVESLIRCFSHNHPHYSSDSIPGLSVLQKSRLHVVAQHLQTLSPRVTDERVRGNRTLLNNTSYQSSRIISSFLRNTKELTPSLTDSKRTLSSPRELCMETVESPQLDPHLLITLIIRFYLLHCVRCAATQSVTDVR